MLIVNNLTMSTLAKASHGQAFSHWAKDKQTHIEAVLDVVLSANGAHSEKLLNAMRYSALGGGKRIRALLCYAAAELCGTEANLADAGASAVELIHAYSLVHDDMPCMDDDDLRRGKPSCHKQYDDATALLVGDALQSLAFSVLSQANICQNASLQLSLVHTLANAAGMSGMAGGQALDLSAVGQPLSQQALEHMHQLKTGALIKASALLGAANGNAAQLAAIEAYANNIGLAFQVVDDILDVEADSATLGKTAGKDAMSNKPTYVTILGLDVAKQHANSLFGAAMDAIAPFGEEAQRLRELGHLIMQRSF
jgi:farnesyl diphosphate synthase